VSELTDGDLAQIEESEAETSRFRVASDFDAAGIAHQRFHSLLFSRSGDRVRRLAEDLWQSAERHRRLMVGSGTDLQAVAQLASVDHGAILRAALERNADECAELVARHIMRVSVITSSIIDGAHHPRILYAAAERALRTSARGDVQPYKPLGQVL
jgi:DNA-binding GntR family transcriptional regulator